MAILADAVMLSSTDRLELERRIRSRNTSVRQARRAQIVLLAAEGRSATEIAQLVGCSVQTVRTWRRAFIDRGLAGLDDRPRSGRPPRIDVAKERQVLRRTLEPPPKELGVDRWSSRLLARHVGLHFTQVAAIWRRWGVQPGSKGAFEFSTDPRLAARIRDVVGLYLHPWMNAIVVHADAECESAAMPRTQAPRAAVRASPLDRTHRGTRNGVAALHVALEKAIREGARARSSRRGEASLARFLRYVAVGHPGRRLHVVLDDHGARNDHGACTAVDGRLRMRLHSTTAASRWLMLVEVFLSIAGRATPRECSVCVPDLVTTITRFVDTDDGRDTFIWTNARRTLHR